MLRALVIAALLMVQLVSAVTPDSNAANGITVLKPNGGDSAHGVTVMSATSGADAATSACATGNCQQSTPAPASNAAPAAAPVSTTTGKPMHPALINHPTNQCGCPVEDDACACNKPQFVAPEIKAEPCGCMNEEVCGCRSSSSSSSSVVTHTVVDECGCLHLEVCGCRRSSTIPETRENTVVPELRDRDTVVTTCGCPVEDTSCGCNKPQYVAPEVKADPCACANQVEVECGCSHFRPNF